MKILLVSNLYRPEPSGVSHYSGDLAESLAARGHDVAVVSANPSYPHWKLYEGFGAWRWSSAREAGVSVRRAPVYVPATPTAKNRLLHYGSFAASALAPLVQLARRWRPDVVIHVVPTLLASPVVLLAARLAKARTWLHVQDFEVEAAFSLGQMSGGRAARAALAFERAVIRRFDKASSISPEMCAKLVNKGCPPERVSELRNWAAIDQIRPQPDSPLRERWGVRTPHVALYSGAIGKKQGLDLVIEAAHRLRHRDDLTFIVCGNGPDRPEMEARTAGLPHFQWHDLQPMAELNNVLNLATVHLLPQRAGAADLVLPSKLTNMLASGRPVVATATAGTGLAREVEGCGLVVPPGDAGAMADGIEHLIDDPASWALYAQAARRRAEEVWDRERIIDRFEVELEQLCLAPRRGGASCATQPPFL